MKKEILTNKIELTIHKKQIKSIKIWLWILGIITFLILYGTL